MTVSNRFSHKAYKKRFVVFATAMIFFFAILTVRLWYMQVVRADYYKNQSENNRIRLRTIKASRGTIFDRNGEILIDNHPYFNLAVVPENVSDLAKLLDTLATVINIDKEKIMTSLEKRRTPDFVPHTIIENLSREEVAKIEAHRLNLPGIEISVESIRYYPYQTLASHIIGYLSEINELKLKMDKYKGYNSGDLLGTFGIEKTYEKFLKGKDGLKQVEVNAVGRELNTLNMKKAEPGNTLFLTLDAKLQEFVERSFKGKAGAVVVMDVKNGDILAQLSKPNFNPALFVKGISSKNWRALADNPLNPLQNKVIRGQYSPGSVFKMVVAAAALEEGVIAKNSIFKCSGTYRLGDMRYKCWKRWGHGKVNLTEAIAQSCDVYFYNLGSILGVDKIAEYAHKFGLGEATGIDLEYEKIGIIPTKKWKRKVKNEKWYDGETVSVSIGQSYVLVTPLQAAVFTATIANGEYVPVPRLLKRIVKADGTTVEGLQPKKGKKLDISKATLAIIKEGMFNVVNKAKGTALASKPTVVTAAGKTGTVQVIANKLRAKLENGQTRYEFEDHAWYVSYAPAEKPQIAIAVIVEHGGHGGSAAAPIAKKIIDYYFKEIAGDDDHV